MHTEPTAQHLLTMFAVNVMMSIVNVMMSIVAWLAVYAPTPITAMLQRRRSERRLARLIGESYAARGTQTVRRPDRSTTSAEDTRW